MLLVTFVVTSTICQAAENNKLPSVLVIGDYISIEYTEPFRIILKNKFKVSHNPGNARDTETGVKNLVKWLDSQMIAYTKTYGQTKPSENFSRTQKIVFM